MTVLLDNLRVRRAEWTAAALPIVELKKQAWRHAGAQKASEEMYDPQGTSAMPILPMNAQQRTLSGGPVGTTAAPVSIPNQLDEQQGALAHLHKTISEIEDHLAAVLSTHAMGAETLNKIDPPESPKFVDRLGRHNREIHLAIQRLQALHGRLHF